MFKVGDEVILIEENFTTRVGVVESVNCTKYKYYPVKVKFTDGVVLSFDTEGRRIIYNPKSLFHNTKLIRAMYEE